MPRSGTSSRSSHTVGIDDALWDELERLEKRTRRSKSDHLNDALRQYVTAERVKAESDLFGPQFKAVLDRIAQVEAGLHTLLGQSAVETVVTQLAVYHLLGGRLVQPDQLPAAIAEFRRAGEQQVRSRRVVARRISRGTVREV